MLITFATRDEKEVLDAVRKALSPEDLYHLEIRGVKGPNDSRWGGQISGIQLRPAHKHYRGSPAVRRISIDVHGGGFEPRSYSMDAGVLMAKVVEITQISRETKECYERQRREQQESHELKKKLANEIGYTDGYALERAGLKRCAHLVPLDEGKVRVSIMADIEGTPEQVRKVLETLRRMELIK